MALLDLPKGQDKLARALEQELGPAEIENNINRCSWKIIDAYLQGVRHFRVTNLFAGKVEIGYENYRGTLDLRYERVLKDYVTEFGRFLKMNVDPVAVRDGENLDSLRKAGIANATLQTLYQKLPRYSLKKKFLTFFLKYGIVGLYHSESGDDNYPDIVEVVHPRELRFLPAYVDGLDNIRGIARKRWVPLDWLQTKLKALKEMGHSVNQLTGASDTDLGAIELAWGSKNPDEEMGGSSGRDSELATTLSTVATTPQGGEGTYVSDESKKKSSGRKIVPVEEIWVYKDGGQRYVARWIMKVGKKIALDVDYESEYPSELFTCPLLVGRHTDIGRAYSRGFVAPKIPFNDQVERMIASVFKNVENIDLYGTLLIPATMGIDTEKLRSGRMPRFMEFEPDYASPHPLKIEALTPVTSGTLPVQAMQVGTQIMDDLAQQGPIYGGQSAGRVDSASAYGFLFDTGNISLGLPAHGMADAFAGLYERLLESARRRYQPGDNLKLAVIDDSVAGLKIDNEGNWGLGDNPIPWPHEVRINVKDREPKDPNVRLQQLLQNVQLGLTDHTDFWLTIFRENIEYPGGPRDMWEAYRKTVWQILILFGDGQQPGQIVVGEYTTMPEIAIRTLQNFMNRIEFSLSSKQVRQAFEIWKSTLEAQMGQYPSALPPPEVAAQMQQAAIQAQQRGGMGGGPLGLPQF